MSFLYKDFGSNEDEISHPRASGRICSMREGEESRVITRVLA